MALASKDGQQIGPWVFCKDFFQDAIRGYLNGISSGIWGYTYNPKTDPAIDMENARVMMTNSADPDFVNKIPAVLDFLNQVEKKMKISLTKAYECENPPASYKKSGVFLFVGDKAWLQSSAALSMWTLLMRNGVVHTVGDKFNDTLDDIIKGKLKPAQRNDHLYLKFGKPGIDLVLENGVEKAFGKDVKKNYAASIATHTIHHNGGIVSYGTAVCAKTWPHWLHPEPPKEPVPGICYG
jgi:hypothetical protein